jgi:hypothetical protein
MQFRPLMVLASSILGPICDVVQSTGECRIEAGAPHSDNVAGSCLYDGKGRPLARDLFGFQLVLIAQFNAHESPSRTIVVDEAFKFLEKLAFYQKV